jgi:ribosomal protein S18 acetylase RimI-like enzyme
MNAGQEEIIIRHFRPQDAEACFKIRNEAFILEFSNDLDPEAVAAAVNAYMLNDYISMSQDMVFFVAEIGDDPVGFCVVRMMDAAIAELFLMYVQRKHLKRGIGTRMLSFVESRLRENHPDLLSLVADTVIPDYNRGFYEKCGFIAEGEQAYSFLDKEVRAVRFRKKL